MLFHELHCVLAPLYFLKHETYHLYNYGGNENDDGCDDVPAIQCSQDEIEDDDERQEHTLPQGVWDGCFVESRGEEKAANQICEKGERTSEGDAQECEKGEIGGPRPRRNKTGIEQ
jgi:hypothetical protein